MLTIKINLSEKDLKEITDDVYYFYGIRMSRPQLNKFLRKHHHLVSEISDMGFDTDTRESFIEHLGEDLVGMIWPANCDTLRYKREFYKAFTVATKKAGIQYEQADAD